VHIKYWSQNLKGGSFLEDLDVDGKIIPGMILRYIGFEGVDRIRPSYDRVQRRALVNILMDLWVP